MSTELRLNKNRNILWHIENDDKLQVCMDTFELQRGVTGGELLSPTRSFMNCQSVMTKPIETDMKWYLLEISNIDFI